jgi:hypothetical protein
VTAPDPRQVLPPWTVVRGDAFKQTVTITSGGSPVNLTTYGTTWAATARRQVDDSTTVPFTVDSTSASTGVLTFSLTASATAALNNSVYYFDVQVTGGTVTPQTPFRGTLIVFKDYTP